MKHFPSAVHWETREAALPRRRRLGYLARHGSTRSWHGTARDVPAKIHKSRFLRYGSSKVGPCRAPSLQPRLFSCPPTGARHKLSSRDLPLQQVAITEGCLRTAWQEQSSALPHRGSLTSSVQRTLPSGSKRGL